MSDLPGGYTIESLIRISKYAARTKTALIIDRDEAVDIAACAIIERLYSDPTPTDTDLFQAARSALTAANQRERSYAGLDNNAEKKNRRELDQPPRFVTYWRSHYMLVSPFEEEIVDRIAVRQVMVELSCRNQETLRVLAEYGTYEAARAALGISKTAWNSRIERARMSARVLWYAPEEPAPQWGYDRPGSRGRSPALERVAKKRRARRREAA